MLCQCIRRCTLAVVFIMHIGKIETWDIISILLNVCEEIVIQIIVQEVTSAFCKTLSRIAFAEVFCHVHYYGDIDDLAGSAFIWAL
jgi:TRAP-type mannitol/chloroaromatic compound transport system permease small subunit